MKFHIRNVDDGKVYEWILEDGVHRLLIDGACSGFCVMAYGGRFAATQNGALLRGARGYVRRWATILVAKRTVEVNAGRRLGVDVRKTTAPRYVRHTTVRDTSPLAERRVSVRELRDAGGWQAVEDSDT